MGAINFGLDQALLASLRRRLPLEIFVETGTFEARTTAAAAPHFRLVYTIELSAELHERAALALAGSAHVQTLQGASPEVLRGLAPQWATSSVMYWLDAHWCGGLTAGAAQECPLLDEIRAIGRLNEQSVILIDDARYFLGPPPAPHRAADWPRLAEIIGELRRVSARHELWVINDVMIYAPDQVADEVVSYGRTHGVDLVNLAALARKGLQPRPSQDEGTGNEGRHGLESGLNRVLVTADRSERIFALHGERLGITRLLDIGANSGQFAAKLRRFGFDGVIYSVEPQTGAHSELMQSAHADPRWIPLARQAAGRVRGRLDLHLAANTWSSSFLATHENHLRAAAGTQTVGYESVFVTKTADLLHDTLIKEIDALKIDVQGYELEVIEGFLSLMGGIRLILLEMSLVECYVGAPDFFALDRLLVDELGFSRVAIEPSFYDDRSGVVQQFDGIYSRDLAPARNRPVNRNPAFSAVVTSMHGTPSRLSPAGVEIGPSWLEYCVGSWQRQASRLISVSEAAPATSLVHWVETGSRPAIADLLAALPDDTEAPAILCNADIAIGDGLTQLRARLDPRTFYMANRLEVQVNAANPQALDGKSVYRLGFDLFVVPAEFLRHVRERKPLGLAFRIGEPWWDYLLPLIAVAAGFPVKRLPVNLPIALHYMHATQYRHETWLTRGADFLAAIERLAHDGASRDVHLLHDVLALEGPPQVRLDAASNLICSRL